MNTIEAVLRSDRFLRVHRSHIVNVRRIAQLWSVAHGEYVIEPGRVSACNRGAPTASGSAAR
jgi:DNA-binding LytR/AlgR family response regulator